MNALSLIIVIAALDGGAPLADAPGEAAGIENPIVQPVESETPVQDVPSVEDVQSVSAAEDGMEDEIRRLMSLQDEIRALLGASSRTQPASATGTDQPAAAQPEPAPVPPPEPPEAISILAAADALYRAGKYDNALELYRKAPAADKEDKCWVLFQQANCLRSAGWPNEALELFQRVITEFPDTFWAAESEWWIAAVQWKTSFREN